MSDYKKAAQRIKLTCAQQCHNYSGSKVIGFRCDSHECRHFVALEALERMTPKKPVKIKYQNSEGYSYRCPNECKHHGGFVCVIPWMKHSNCCGQLIDWSDENGNT